MVCVSNFFAKFSTSISTDHCRFIANQGTEDNLQCYISQDVCDVSQNNSTNWQNSDSYND